MLAQTDGAQLHYEIAGKGDPVLLIMGLGMASTAWWRTVPVLAKRLRVITFDNRGAGRSDAPRGPYTLRQLAADAVAVLDAAGEERAHVYGFSLGGMIAQELALRHPERVSKLVLGATTPGGRHHELPDKDTLGFLERRTKMPDRGGRLGVDPVQLRTQHTPGTRGPDRCGHCATAAVPAKHRRLQGAARRCMEVRCGRSPRRGDAHRHSSFTGARTA